MGHGIHCFYNRLWDRFEVDIYVNKSFIYRKLYDQSYLIYIQCTSIKNGEELCHEVIDMNGS